MNREYNKQYSQELGRDMESLVYGHAGQPILVFPTSRGRFFEYEDAGMIRALSSKLEAGAIQLFCVDAVDGESLYNKSVHPGARIWRHVQYERYVGNEFSAVPEMEELGAADCGHRMQFWRLSRAEFFHAASRRRIGLHEHERIVRHQKFPRRLLR